MHSKTLPVKLMDIQSTVSGIVEDAISTIARKHEYTRFVKLNYRDAEMSPAAVPAILAYKAGDLIANLVSIIDEIPAGRDLSTSSLELVLQQYDITCYPPTLLSAHCFIGNTYYDLTHLCKKLYVLEYISLPFWPFWLFIWGILRA